jgi:ATP-dependent DNA ligase
VDDNELAIAVRLGMGIDTGDAAVGGPTGVAHADMAFERVALEDLDQAVELADGTADGNLSLTVDDGDAGGVVAAVFEAAQALDDNWHGLTFTDVADDAAHLLGSAAFANELENRFIEVREAGDGAHAHEYDEGGLEKPPETGAEDHRALLTAEVYWAKLMNLPVMPPLAPMLAKLQTDIPEGDGWLYEPKWDGFRAIVFRDGDDIEIGSRDKRPLQRYFPELVTVLCEVLPERCVMDGEIIIANSEGLDFNSLQLRLHPAESRVRKLAGEIPASFVAFDLLALGDEDLRKQPLARRRQMLERELAGVSAATFEFLKDVRQLEACVMLTPQTRDAGEARRWFEELERIKLEGLVAKRDDQPYVPGERTMVKIKHRRTVDCVVGGYRKQRTGEGLGALLLGLYDKDGVLHYVGHTSSFSREEGRQVLEMLKPLEGGDSFGFGRTPGGLSRWSAGKGETEWVNVTAKLVCEVSFDYLQGDRFRHAARLERWREDKEPSECGWDQLTGEAPGVRGEKTG